MPQTAPKLAGTATHDFLSCLADALGGSVEPPVKAMEARIRDAVRTTGTPVNCIPRRLPACSHLPEAIATASSASEILARLMGGFAAIEPYLAGTTVQRVAPTRATTGRMATPSRRSSGQKAWKVDQDCRSEFLYWRRKCAIPTTVTRRRRFTSCCHLGGFSMVPPHGLSPASAALFTTCQISSTQWPRMPRPYWRCGVSGQHRQRRPNGRDFRECGFLRAHPVAGGYLNKALSSLPQPNIAHRSD